VHASGVVRAVGLAESSDAACPEGNESATTAAHMTTLGKAFIAPHLRDKDLPAALIIAAPITAVQINQ
jgi:hypothetical protein